MRRVKLPAVPLFEDAEPEAAAPLACCDSSAPSELSGVPWRYSRTRPSTVPATTAATSVDASVVTTFSLRLRRYADTRGRYGPAGMPQGGATSKGLPQPGQVPGFSQASRSLGHHHQESA